MKRARTPIDTSSRETRTAAAFKSAFVCGIAVLSLLFLAAAFQPAPPETVSVIVQAESLEAAIAVVRAAGGTVSRELGIIRSVSAEVTPAQRAQLENRRSLRSRMD